MRGTIIRVQVERVPARTRPPKVLWPWWADVRRFAPEHTIRFAKQTLGWTTPRPRHPAQADRWTWLGLAGYAQLPLARRLVADSGCRGSGPDPTANVTAAGPPWLPRLRLRVEVTGLPSDVVARVEVTGPEEYREPADADDPGSVSRAAPASRAAAVPTTGTARA